MQALGRAMAVLYNATGDQQCLQLELSGPAGGPGLRTWLYQTCTVAASAGAAVLPRKRRTLRHVLGSRYLLPRGRVL